MEYSKFITEKAPELLKMANITRTVIDNCRAEGIISLEEKQILEAADTNIKKNSIFWGIVQTRKDKLEAVKTIFANDDQDGVVDILGKAERDDGSDKKYNFVKNLKPLEVFVYKPDKPEAQSDDWYQLENDTRGLALIINVVNFDGVKTRHGSKKDTAYMENLWKQMDYQTFVHEGRLTAADVTNKVDQFLKKFERQPAKQSCVVFIGTHGEEGKLIFSDGSELALFDEFILKFTDSPFLKAKPKIFIMEACQYFPNINVNAPQFSDIKDTIVCYPSLPGDPAHRDSILGSWYIYTLTDVFMQDAYRMEIKEMLKLVRRKMLTELKSEEDVEQLPYYRDFKMKPLYFNLCKE